MDNIIKTLNIESFQHKFQVVSIMKTLTDDFKIDEINKETINKLFNYFIGNQKFCDENNLSLRKGILLVGGIGTGKTVLMRGFKTYTGEFLRTNSFQWYQSSEVIDTVNVSGISYLENFNHRMNDRNIADPITCYIDDICSKNETVKNYGTEINVIEQLINMRYIVYNRYNKLTHFSTNIYPAEMSKYYDERIIDRLIEMCNIIELNGNSRRK